MDNPSVTLAVLGIVAIFLPLAYFGGRYYVTRARRVFAGEQNVDASGFGPADLLTVGALALWFSLMVIQLVSGAGGESAAEASKPGETAAVSIPVLQRTILVHLMLVGGIALSLQTRGQSVIELFGLRRLPWRQVFKTGLIAYLAAYPVLKCVVGVTALTLQENAEQQAIVSFFFNAVRDHQWLAIGLTIFSAAILAPISEEFVFRGFFYGVLKRYAGPLAAIVVTSALFALIHFNALSFPALFVFAVGLTVIYEITGCLWVPMVIHCLFNTISLLETILLSRLVA